MSIESRIKRIEDTVGGGTVTPRTLEEMGAAFINGEFGPPADTFRQILSGATIYHPGGRVPEELFNHLAAVHQGGEADRK